MWEQKIRNAKVAPWEANGLTGEDHNQNNQNMNGGSSNSAHYMQQQSLQQIQAQNDPNLKVIVLFWLIFENYLLSFYV